MFGPKPSQAETPAPGNETMHIESSSEIEIALFPIPGSVCMPGSRVPLHVFEPRYRALIKDSVRLKRRVGVCHTKKVIHAAKLGQTQAEVLNSNQATYEPHAIFSAGFADILQITADGRLLVEITTEQRFEKRADVQVLPYRIALCRPYRDKGLTLDSPRLKFLRAQIEDSLTDIAGEKTGNLVEYIRSEEWKKQSDVDFSFNVFKLFRFDPEMMQMVLEIRSPEQRLGFLAQFVRSSTHV